MSTLSTAMPTLTGGSGPGLRRLYLSRAGAAIVWAAAFAALAAHFSTGTKILLVLYPAIDVVASVLDARAQRGLGTSTVQFVNAAVSAVALVALAIAVGHDQATVLHVFGAWAVVSGLIQLTVAVRRRPYLGRQTAMLVSGAVSTIAGIAFNAMATATDPKVRNLAGYAALGALLFIVGAVRLRAVEKR